MEFLSIQRKIFSVYQVLNAKSSGVAPRAPFLPNAP